MYNSLQLWQLNMFPWVCRFSHHEFKLDRINFKEFALGVKIILTNPILKIYKNIKQHVLFSLFIATKWNQPEVVASLVIASGHNLVANDDKIVVFKWILPWRINRIIIKVTLGARGVGESDITSTGAQSMMAMNYHLLFKILLVGDREVGKAAILHPAAGDSPLTSSIGVNFLKRKLELGKYVCILWSVMSIQSLQNFDLAWLSFRSTV